MNNFLVKVDRVTSITEALELQDLGVDLIGVSLKKNVNFSDDRYVDREVAILIRRELQKSKFIGEVVVEENFLNTISLIYDIGFDYVQLSENQLPPVEFIQELKSKGVGLIYSGIEASYEDDPSWILSRYHSISDLNVSFFQIDLLGDIENSWDFLKNESPNYPDELQIEDIEEIGKTYPIIITLDYTPDNLPEITKRISSIKGIAMTLCESSNRNDIHCFNYASVIEILKKNTYPM